jgi:hypothetical protein
MRARISRELELLKDTWPDVEHVEVSGEDWFRLPRYPLPSGWLLDGQPITTAPILFVATAAYPGSDPYAFWAPKGLTYNGDEPTNVTEAKNAAFDGDWLQFSWQPDGDWQATEPAEKGSNLRVWAESFHKRLKEGL